MTPWSVEIVVEGRFDAASDPDLHGAEITTSGDVTSLRLLTRDAAALYAMLDRLQAQGLELVAVHRSDPGSPP